MRGAGYICMYVHMYICLYVYMYTCIPSITVLYMYKGGVAEIEGATRRILRGVSVSVGRGRLFQQLDLVGNLSLDAHDVSLFGAYPI